MKKMNQTEIKAVAKKILKEVNEVNKVYNDTIINSQPYKDEIERIKNQNPLIKIQEDLEKQLKVALGSNYKDNVSLNLSPVNNGIYKEVILKVEKETLEYKKKALKPLYSETVSCNWITNEAYDNIIEEITIAQITISDIQMLINSIKSKLI